MLKRFIVAFLVFIAVVIPGAFLLALLAGPAEPAPLKVPACVGHPTSFISSPQFHGTSFEME